MSSGSALGDLCLPRQAIRQQRAVDYQVSLLISLQQRMADRGVGSWPLNHSAVASGRRTSFEARSETIYCPGYPKSGMAPRTSSPIWCRATKSLLTPAEQMGRCDRPLLPSMRSQSFSTLSARFLSHTSHWPTHTTRSMQRQTSPPSNRLPCPRRNMFPGYSRRWQKSENELLSAWTRAWLSRLFMWSGYNADTR